MSIFAQGLLDIHDDLIVDLFAGGGGASCGIEMATGRQVDIAINHDPAAVAMHEANHPQTKHHVVDVFEADPPTVTGGRPVGLLWASPDCTHHSKARGGKPLRDAARKRRALAWVVTRWAGQVRPRVIMLENVEEFEQWGPLIGPPDNLQPCPRRRGRTFRRWVRSLERLGYRVEWRELRACDYGAPTIRKRLFLVARCDGRPIVWPEPTHGKVKGLKPFRTAAECIDWSIPMCSIFATREEAREWGRLHGQASPVRPLADATMRRVARGVWRYVIDNPRPFLVSLAHGESGGRREYPMDNSTGTQHSGGNKFALVAAFLAQNNEGDRPMNGRSLEDPNGTVCVSGSHQSLVAVHLTHNYTSNTAGGSGDLDEPLKTVTTGGHAALVASFLASYYGQGIGQKADKPMRTVTTKDRMGLVTVKVKGKLRVIVDILMRMLQPRELYRAQGFPDSYVIDRGAGGRQFTKTEQVRMVGNSVVPQLAAALVRSNVPEMIARDEARKIA